MKDNQNIQIEFDVDESKYDQNNPLIAYDNKNVKKINKKLRTKKEEIKKQLLSKKKKKQLEKVLERKNRKLNRANLLNDLKKYQINDNDYESMPSTSIIQTVGKRKINDLLELYKSINKNDNDNNDSLVENKSSRKKYKIHKINFKINEKNFNRKDPHIIGFNNKIKNNDNVGQFTSSEDDSDDNDEEFTSSDNDNDNDNDRSKPVEEKNKDPPSNKVEINDKNKCSIDNQDVNDKKNETKNIINEDKKMKSRFVVVDRPDEIQKARERLPILSEEHNIMDLINHNQVVIICGETGSGKTTQVPQFLYEAGYTFNDKLIGITEPRRVAAIAMSKRVAYELNMSEKEVSYQIRFEGNVTDKTKIKFMTDGILMKELERDLYLTKYSAIIIDEAHERSLYSDILIGFLSRIIQYRHRIGDPLKLIIMSATLRVEDFTENKHLFKISPPIIKIDSRQYPVTIHFSKYTNSNYIQEAYKKVCKIHSTSQPGGILVFVTGRNEVKSLCRMLKTKFPMNNCNNYNIMKKNDKKFNKSKKSINDNNNNNNNDDDEQNSNCNTIIKTRINLDFVSIDPIETSETINDNIDLCDNNSDYENDDDDDNENNDYDENFGFITTTEPLYCLPLYSMLSSEKQSLVFHPTPEGCRLCVIATNIAETSLTIPNIRYVIDTGKVKNIVYDRVTSVSTFQIEWTSKASADQRSGRAGRTSAGHCYRLYSSAVFNDQFKQYSDPEILQKPIDDLILQMKSIGFENVTNFPFPTKPNIEALITAEKLLIQLDALEKIPMIRKKQQDNEVFERTKITWFGRLMSNFPVSPRFSRILLLSTQADLVQLIVTLISLLTVQEFFMSDVSNTIKQRRENWFFSHPFSQILGDLWTMLSAFGSAHYHDFSEKFCLQHGLRFNAIREANKLRLQLFNQLQMILKKQKFSAELSVPNELQVKMLSKLFLSGFSDHIAKRIPSITITENVNKNNDNDNNGEIRKIQKSIKNCYQSIEMDQYVFISPNSVLFNQTFDYVCYQEIFESSDSNKMYMRNVVPIQMEWLPIYGQKYCKFSNPLETPKPRYDYDNDCIKCYRKSTFGVHGWELPPIEVEYPDCMEKYCYFAYFLFNGEIFNSLKEHLKFISSPTILFLKSWATVQPKVDNVIKCLMNNKINNRCTILNKWKTNPKFLLKEYLEWFNDNNEHKNNIRKLWPPK